MTDDFHTPEPAEEESSDQIDEAQQEEATPATNDFTSGEGLVAVGGIVIIAVWVIFEVIADEYGVPALAVALGIAAAVLPRVRRENVESIHRLPVIMKVIGYSLAVIGLIEIIEELRFGILEAGAIPILAALAAYAGYIMAFMGARSIKT